ncbi:HK97 family phage prohead protease [Mesorhizobium sp. AaZ16]|uniref:HK97 family phage prohead protease n=1 Tax=Mesorhizobium sp. AaZ16 TaxID=3402289 RepID=UPI00374EB100
MALLELETRTKSIDPADGNLIAGYAAIFHSEAVIAGEFREKIAPGAFARSLRENDVVALIAHDSGRVLGRMSSGTLRLREDAKGLAFDLHADPSTPDGATALGLVRRRDLRGMSFGFRVRDEAWTETSGLPLRTLNDIDLAEITLTAFPAYENTTAALRSLAAFRSAAAARLAMRMKTDLRVRGRQL